MRRPWYADPDLEATLGPLERERLRRRKPGRHTSVVAPAPALLVTTKQRPMNADESLRWRILFALREAGPRSAQALAHYLPGITQAEIERALFNLAVAGVVAKPGGVQEWHALNMEVTK